MKLTGKAKEDFEKWYLLDYNKKPFNMRTKCELTDPTKADKAFAMNIFYKAIMPSMQYGVYVDWFDSVGIEIEIAKIQALNFWYFMINDSADNPKQHESRPEARTAAIEKGFEIYNN